MDSCDVTKYFHIMCVCVCSSALLVTGCEKRRTYFSPLPPPPCTSPTMSPPSSDRKTTTHSYIAQKKSKMFILECHPIHLLEKKSHRTYLKACSHCCWHSKLRLILLLGKLCLLQQIGSAPWPKEVRSFVWMSVLHGLASARCRNLNTLPCFYRFFFSYCILQEL